MDSNHRPQPYQGQQQEGGKTYNFALIFLYFSTFWEIVNRCQGYLLCIKFVYPDTNFTGFFDGIGGDTKFVYH